MILLEIININKVLSDYFKNKNGGFPVSITSMFLNGYCLEYYEILKTLHSDAVLVIEKDNNHCATLIDGIVYDVSGYQSMNYFFIPDADETNFIYSFFNHFEKEELDTIKTIVKNKLCTYIKKYK